MIFVISLIDFNRLCYEDEVTNRMEESLNCFSHFINLKHQSFNHTNISEFIDRPCYVIFNKMDKFQSIACSIKSANFTQETNDTDPQQLHRIVDMFKQRDIKGKVKMFFFLSALNVEEVKKCFDTILENLKEEEGS